MKKQIILLPPSMPNFISIEGIESSGESKPMISVSQLTDTEAEQYGELMKQTFIKHHKNKNRIKKENVKGFPHKPVFHGSIGLILLFPIISFSQSVYTYKNQGGSKETTIVRDHKGTDVAHIERSDSGTVYMIADTLGTIQSLYNVNYMNTRLLLMKKKRKKTYTFRIK